MYGDSASAGHTDSASVLSSEADGEEYVNTIVDLCTESTDVLPTEELDFSNDILEDSVFSVEVLAYNDSGPRRVLEDSRRQAPSARTAGDLERKCGGVRELES